MSNSPFPDPIPDTTARTDGVISNSGNYDRCPIDGCDEAEAKNVPGPPRVPGQWFCVNHRHLAAKWNREHPPGNHDKQPTSANCQDNSATDAEVFYPGIIDQKTLAACLETAEQIIRDPRPDRVERFQRTKSKLITQVKAHPLSFDEWNARAALSRKPEQAHEPLRVGPPESDFDLGDDLKNIIEPEPVAERYEECPNCTSTIQVDSGATVVECPHCDEVFPIDAKIRRPVAERCVLCGHSDGVDAVGMCLFGIKDAGKKTWDCECKCVFPPVAETEDYQPCPDPRCNDTLGAMPIPQCATAVAWAEKADAESRLAGEWELRYNKAVAQTVAVPDRAGEGVPEQIWIDGEPNTWDYNHYWRAPKAATDIKYTRTRSPVTVDEAAARDLAQQIVIDASRAAGYSDSTWLEGSFKYHLTKRITKELNTASIEPVAQTGEQQWKCRQCGIDIPVPSYCKRCWAS